MVANETNEDVMAQFEYSPLEKGNLPSHAKKTFCFVLFSLSRTEELVSTAGLGDPRALTCLLVGREQLPYLPTCLCALVSSACHNKMP